MFDSLHEECGVFGIFENQTTTVAQTAYLALFALQHRGQESCGIAVNDDGVFRHHRGDGLVPDVFSKEQLAALGTGNMAIGHVRYSTTGGKNGGGATLTPEAAALLAAYEEYCSELNTYAKTLFTEKFEQIL